MSSAYHVKIAAIAAVSFCLSGCRLVEQSDPVDANPRPKQDSLGEKTRPEGPLVCLAQASLAYLRDSSVVLNSRTVAITEITSNSVYGSGYDPDYAFDGMPAGNWTQWISDDDFRPFTRASVIQVRYASPRAAVGYTLLGRYESLKDRLPKDWILQGSNDVSGSAEDPLGSARWTTLDSAVGMSIGDEWNSSIAYAGITRAISCPRSFSRYRLCVTAVNGSSVVDLIEVQLLARPDGQLLSPRDSARNPPERPGDPPSDTVWTDTVRVPVDSIPPVMSDTTVVRKDTIYSTNSVYGSGYGPENAFDRMPPGNWTQWISDDLFRPYVHAAIIQVEYPVARRIGSYTLMGRYESLKDRLPKDWVMQGSNGASASVKDDLTSPQWTNLDAVWGAEIGGDWNSATSSARLTRTMTNPGTYKKYRLCVTAVNGSSVVDLIEIEMNP